MREFDWRARQPWYHDGTYRETAFGESYERRHRERRDRNERLEAIRRPGPMTE